eukprot:TRINITY_DN17426_c0_g1_i1.p1 TRINITY_DN17426_c0_g1~~TRINITY_DN17426_c0_g1_i1.p1  ORF type:complete len:234 (+),score=5.35 TRINITY_DN17426_c0_g1_i1:8-709(+)
MATTGPPPGIVVMDMPDFNFLWACRTAINDMIMELKNRKKAEKQAQKEALAKAKLEARLAGGLKALKKPVNSPRKPKTIKGHPVLELYANIKITAVPSIDGATLPKFAKLISRSESDVKFLVDSFKWAMSTQESLLFSYGDTVMGSTYNFTHRCHELVVAEFDQNKFAVGREYAAKGKNILETLIRDPKKLNEIPGGDRMRTLFEALLLTRLYQDNFIQRDWGGLGGVKLMAS